MSPTVPPQQEYSTPEGAALPQHIAIIMDGNGRWAAERGVSIVRGHSQGGEAFRGLVESCRARPFIKYLTLYAFSIENWKRPAGEVEDLMNLVRHYMKREAPTMNENNVRMRFIGDFSNLAPDIRNDLAEVEELTKNNTRLTVTMAVSYGARQELRYAMQQLAFKVARGELKPEAINEAMIAEHLHTAGIPDPDLIVRTGGDQRLSNFLLWQSAYTELYFDPVLWPDYTAENLDQAIASFSQRDRRYGKRKAS